MPGIARGRWNVVCGVLLAAALLVGHDARAARDRVRVGCEAGLNQAKVSWASDLGLAEPDRGPDFRPAWCAGVTLDLSLAPRLSLATGLGYIEYGSRVEYDPLPAGSADRPAGAGGSLGFGLQQTWSYLAIPVHVRVRPFPARGVFLGLGPEVGYLLAVRGRYDPAIGADPSSHQQVQAVVTRPGAQIYEEVGSAFDLPGLDDYSRWNLALCGGVGCEFPVGGHLGVVEARYTHGLVDIDERDWVERTTRGVEFLVGARW